MFHEISFNMLAHFQNVLADSLTTVQTWSA